MNRKETTIVIYSVGLLGSSLGLAFRKSGFKGKIIGLSSPKAIDKAIELGCINEGFGYDKLKDVIKTADIIFLCSPIEIILKTIKKLATLKLPNGLIITDIGSTKSIIANEAESLLPEEVNFIAGHPMAGSEKSGPAAADPYLFQNAVYILHKSPKTVDSLFNLFSSFLVEHLGCRIANIDPETHDIIAATVSHVPHLLAVALMNTAGIMDNKKNGTIDLAAGGFKDMTRIASAPYKIWHDIFTTNREPISKVLDICINQLVDMKKKLQLDALEESFEKASELRIQIPAGSKGFLNTLSEVFVIAEDQPGMIAKISQLLLDDMINIKDIEVLKVREGEGGTIRLAFDDDATAKKAIQILNENDFFARKRI